MKFALKNRVFFCVFLQGCKDIEPVHPKGDQSCSLEGLMLKLKLQYFGHMMWSWLIGKDPDAE